jgi:hypothetical protein
MSWNDEAVKRVLKVHKLSQDCVRYVQPDKEALANQILVALSKATAKKSAPVKLSEITETIYGTAEKDKQDVIRLTMQKTLLKCGIVDKIYVSERDVRYFPVAYRFQEVQRVETGAGSKLEQPVGDVIELSRENWPIPKEFFELVTTKAGYEDALIKLDEDSRSGSVDSQAQQRIKSKLQKGLDDVSKRLKEFEALTDLMKT